MQPGDLETQLAVLRSAFGSRQECGLDTVPDITRLCAKGSTYTEALQP